MKIERINDNSIRCTLSSMDLSARNINLRDMTYGSSSARKLFGEMMQIAQNELGFTSDNEPLMIEAVPLQGGSIQLIITKVEDPEELDTRFSKFSVNAYRNPEQDQWLNQLASDILEGAQGIISKLHDKENKTLLTDETGKNSLRIYCFSSLDRVCSAAVNIGDEYKGKNTLYKDEENNRYYLVLEAEEDNAKALSRVCNLLSEYGKKIQGELINQAYYEEHFKVIVRDKAILVLSNI